VKQPRRNSKPEIEKLRELIEAYDFEEASGVVDNLLGHLRGG
jgi:protein-arginine kinase activator protein McsA